MSIPYEYAGRSDAAGNPTKSSNGRGQRAIVEFPPNVPVQLALKYTKPRIIQTKRGLRYMVTTTANGVAFLEADPALKIEHLNIKPGELFWIARKSSGTEDALESWDVWLDPSTERARSNRPPARTNSPELPRPATGTISSDQDNAIRMGWAQHLISVTDALIDAYAACLKYSERHGAAVRNEDVRTLLTTAFIAQCSRKGSPDVA